MVGYSVINTSECLFHSSAVLENPSFLQSASKHDDVSECPFLSRSSQGCFPGMALYFEGLGGKPYSGETAPKMFPPLLSFTRREQHKLIFILGWELLYEKLVFRPMFSKQITLTAFEQGNLHTGNSQVYKCSTKHVPLNVKTISLFS